MSPRRLLEQLPRPSAATGSQLEEPFNEECDDGNDIDDDGCRDDCTLSFCGDGLVQTGVFQTFGRYDFEEAEIPSQFRTVGAGWEFTDDASSGEQALVNVDIDDGQSAGFEIDVDFPVETLVIFDAKVSSESCCDELNVRRNGVELLRIVAQEEYAEFQVVVPPGLGTPSHLRQGRLGEHRPRQRMAGQPPLRDAVR